MKNIVSVPSTQRCREEEQCNNYDSLASTGNRLEREESFHVISLKVPECHKDGDEKMMGVENETES